MEMEVESFVNRFCEMVKQIKPDQREKIMVETDKFRSAEPEEAGKIIERVAKMYRQFLKENSQPPPPPDDFKSYRECRDMYFRKDNPLTLSQKRHCYLWLNSLWMRLDAEKIYDFYWDEQEEATEEIVAALRARNAADASEKDWEDQEYYKQARMLFEDIRRVGHICDPRVMDFYFKKDIAMMQRDFFLEVVVQNDNPKKRRGRRKKAHLELLKGGWDGKCPDSFPWHAADLYPWKRA